MRLRLGVCGLLLSVASTANSGERLTIAVSPMSSFAPTNLAVRVHVTPDAANRALEVAADSGAYFRSSRIQLDGQDARTTMMLEFRNVPGGDYDVRATLIGSGGQERGYAHQLVRVIPSAADEQ
ncbi:MAG TPA: hypothetical protein VGZ27_13225 [Vicinamibacterales bacterium]|jgi:hypothetical protein|nr:hypothetical protein [Vicinamibacterales bacterium]